MIRRHSWIPAVVVLAGSAAITLADVPPRSDGGQTLVVPQEQLDAGDVYYVTPGEDTQLLCLSDAALQRMTVTCSRIVGYVVTPFELEEGKPPLVAGAFRIPVAALETGCPESAELLRGPTVLNAAEYPEMTFRILRVTDFKSAGDEGRRKNFTLTIAGELTVKDKTVELEVPVRMSLIPFTWKTMGRNVGELLTLRAKLDVKLADLGLARPSPAYAERIADTLDLDVFLLCNTMTPEKLLDPAIKKEHHLKQMRFLTLVRDLNDPEKAYEFGRTYLRDIWSDAQALNRLAWATLTEAGIQTRDLGFATKAAQRANELTEFKDPALLNTLARACYDKADLDAALKWARQAAENLGSTPAPVAEEIRATLKRYEAQAEKTRE
jgi:polyisoprenoid-binding protein YceI